MVSHRYTLGLTSFLLIFLGIGGLVGGVSFMASPDGSGLGMTTNLLDHAPVDNYFWPGVFLLLFMSAWPFLTTYGLLAHKQWAGKSLRMLGVVTMAWIVYETITIRTFSPLQPIIFLIGAGLVAAGSQRLPSNTT